MMNILDHKITTKLSLAIELKDEFAPHLKPKGNILVILNNILRNGANRSGYYVFRDITDGYYTVDIKAKYYLDESLNVDIPRPDSQNPVVISPAVSMSTAVSVSPPTSLKPAA